MKYIEVAKKNIRRTPYQALAASLIMFLTFLTLLIFLLLAIGSEQILKFYEGKPQVIAFFKDNTTDEDFQKLDRALKATGRVTQVKFVSKDEALKIYQERNKNEPALLELVTASILPASLEVSTQSPQDLETIAQLLLKEPVVGDVIVPKDAIEVIINATSIIRTVGSFVVATLILFSFLVVLMIIGFKIRIKRTEIETMRLLGASSWFIKIPFILEGITYGLAGAFFAWVIVYGVLWYFTPFIQGYLNEIQLLPVSPLVMFYLLGVISLVAVLVGGMGSFGAVRRYLKI